MENPTGAVTPEAKRLNPPDIDAGGDHDAVYGRGGMLATYQDIPNGRIWDERHAALVRDVNELWAPFTVLRKQLIEAGWRAIGPAMLLSAQEQEDFWYHREALNGVHGEEEKTKHRQHGSGIATYPR